MDKIDLKGSMFMLLTLLGVYGTYKLLQFIYLLVVGATANVASSGDIAVPTSINNTINTTITSVNTGFTAFNTAELVVIGLIALVVIVKVFWPLISSYLPKSGGRGLN